MSTRRIVIAILTLGIVCAPVLAEAQRVREAPRFSGLEVGPSPVGTIPDVTLKDTARDKEIELTIDYPTRGTNHPLIVLSPGFGGTQEAYVGLSSYWAGSNFVVIRVNHADRTIGVMDAADVWEMTTAADWKNRVRDISFVLDSLETLAKDYPELEGKIDAAKIAVAGHAYGAHTAMLIGGARTFPGGVSYADPRVKAIVAMSPEGRSASRGFTSESWLDVRIPALYMTGSLDRGTVEGETPEWRSDAFQLSAAGDKWLVKFEGANHATFAGGAPMIEQIARERAKIGSATIPGAPDPNDPGDIGKRPPTREDVMTGTRLQPGNSRTERLLLKQKEIFANIRGVALTFLDTYLHGDTAARESLEKSSERKGVALEKK